MVEEEIKVEEEKIVEEVSLMGIGGLDEELVEVKVSEEKPSVRAEKEEIEAEKKGDKNKEEKEEEIPAKVDPNVEGAEWEKEENPYKKRYLDTQSWGTKATQARIILEQQNAKLEANIADVRKELELSEYKPSVEESSKEEFTNRLAISERATYVAYGQGDVKKGEELVNELIGPKSGFLELAQGNPAIRQRFLNSISPAAEAILIMKEQNKLSAFGDKTPEEFKAEIRKELEEEVKTKATIKDKLKDAPKGLPRKQGEARGSTQQQGGVDSLASLSGLG